MTEYKRKSVKRKKKEPGIIKLDKEYRLKTDDWNITLERLHIKESGEKEWLPISYHNTFPAALKSYCSKDLKRSDSLEDLIKRLEGLESMFESLLKQCS